MKLWERLKQNYRLLTSDLSLQDIMRGFKSDASNTFQYYSREADPEYQNRVRKPKFFRLIKNLFLAFIKKLSPVRRIAYLAVLFLFFSGLNQDDGEGKVLFSFIILNIILAAELADKLTVKDELDVARNIQIGIMPKQPPDDPRFDIAFQYESANTVGGDFYDFLLPPDHDGFVAMVGDISGKGMEAALHMVQVHTLIHSQPYPQDLSLMLVNLNRQLRHLFPANQFLTGNFLRFKSGSSIEFCRAGHLPLYHYSADDRTCRAVSPSGLGLGLADQDRLKASLEKVEIQGKSGDVLCLCTDGAIETENNQAQEFGEIRFRDAIKQHHRDSAKEIAIFLLKEIALFRGGAQKKDDLTLLVIKIK
jgi:sigma-B regulation protein RsbU (phosphoserine phosphatase)